MRSVFYPTVLMAMVCGWAGPLYAAEDMGADADQQASDAIVVTAKQATTALDDYAGSAAVFDQNQLLGRHVDTLSALSFAVPNASLDDIGTFRGTANFAIRGLGVNSSIPSIDPAVGLFVDNMFMGINAGAVYDALDLETVQVLRGPQSVLFGRNTTGGAVLVKTGEPTWTWQNSARINFEAPLAKGRGAPTASIRAVASGPLSERVAIRIAGLQSSDGGYFRNDYDGQPFGAFDTSILRGKMLVRATDRLTLNLKAEWMKADGEGAASHNNGLFPRDNFRLSLNERGFHHSTSHILSLTAEWEVGAGQLTSISAWRDYRLRTRNDIDSSPETIFHSDTGTQQDQWSQEIFYRHQANGHDLLFGAYAFGQKQGYDEDRNLAGFGQPKNYGGGRQQHQLYSLYSSADIPLSSNLTLNAGLRASYERKQAQITYVRARAACSAISATCPVDGERVDGENNGFTDKRDWTSWSPKLGLSWRAAERTQIYANWQRGQRSGGYNLRITQPAAFEQIAAANGSPAFGTERVDNFEVGVKWRSDDRKFHVSGAIFWTEVGDMQREINMASSTSGLAQSIYNTADARIRGAELEGEFSPSAALRLRANIGYIDADYKHIFYDISGDGVIDGADLALHLPRVPTWTWGGGAEWRHALGRNMLMVQSDFQHRTRYAYTDNNYGWVDAIDSWNASIALDLQQPAMRFSLYGRNLLDQVQFGGDTQLAFAGGPNSDGQDSPFDPRPAAGTFSPMMKGRQIGLQWDMRF
ncbi:TonB-dependent receptor [Sphingopyxis yananensis]|uniref:TonB-dependent receptor n=1 Tax=Sphingopyxis yananensis TaxID=2886687 RepID=UPI001D11A902|nr:TonB-dependent receptor [Sphingopyxis yananensis]MCC2603063.1 TonB-dependent receptor [Sphingopyxis yananensis]